MITFLLEEGVITVGTLSGIFTTGLLNSLKANIIDPGIENIFPSHILDVKKIDQSNVGDNKSNFGDMFPLPTGSPETSPNLKSNTVRWQTFLKDFITWLVIMFCLYIFWKKILQPMKTQRV